MSISLVETPSSTEFVELEEPGKGDVSASVNGRKAILVSPKISPAEEPVITWIGEPRPAEELKSMTPKARVRSPRVRSTEGPVAEEFRKIRKYDGVIIKRSEDSFWARLRETPAQFPTIEAEFDLNQLSESDKELALEGVPIVWTLGFGRDRGTWIRESIVYVRRLQAPSEDELEKSRAEVREMMSDIVWG